MRPTLDELKSGTSNVTHYDMWDNIPIRILSSPLSPNFVAIDLINRAAGQAEIWTSALAHNLPNNTIPPVLPPIVCDSHYKPSSPTPNHNHDDC